MAFNPTTEQGYAIDKSGNILVSAAAGSGKTAVLVERVIKKLSSKTDGVSADKLLIVTFTNAAAAEMRGRIEKRLEEEIIKKPQDTALLMQKHLLNSAKICTIDSFCIDLVRENFEKLGVTPDFIISDGESLKTTNDKVLSDIINRYLEEKNPVFDELLDIIGSEFDENKFSEFVLDIYDYSRQLPFPTKWFENLSCNYNGGTFDKENIWYKYAFSRAKSIIEGSRNSLANAIDLLNVSEKAVEIYMPNFIELSEYLNDLLDACNSGDWDSLYNLSSPFKLSALSRKKVPKLFEVDAAKNIYKYIGDKAIEKINKLFYADYNSINSQFEKIYKPLCLLTDILKEFETVIFNEYKKLNTFTFHNTEHLALELLCEEAEDGIKIKDEAKELLNRFEEVMVDEYQDTNDLQDMLFYVLSNKEKRLFVVGDVKQSIYGFRGANPKNFLAKKNRYIPINAAKEDDPKKIILGNNFRCKPEVCDFINFVFTLFMNEETGDIIYNEEEKLIASSVYPETDNISTELLLINKNDSDLEDIKIEAQHIANYINKTMAEGKVIRENEETLRNANYGDFTILLRSAKLKAPPLAEELKRLGIPVTYNLENFTECFEISIFLSLLKVIDNPRSDIELLSVMMSPIFGFTPEEMAKIRVDKGKDELYLAVVYAAENGNTKAKEFLSKLEKYRLLAAVTPLPKLITILLNETDFIEISTAMTDGTRRRNNLLLLSEYAASFCNNGNSSITSFVKFINNQSKLKAANSLTGSDSVRIMSIHASKGLQFPVCILAGLASNFNDNEAKENTLYSTDFGIGFKYFDETEKTKCTTISRESILDKIRAERLCEELRLLYVAMTRTQDRLFMTATLNNVLEKSNELSTLLIASNCEIDYNLFSRTKSYADWLILAMLLHPCGKELRENSHSLIVKSDNSNIKLSVVEYKDIEPLENTEKSVSIQMDEELISAVKENISYKYPYEELMNIESKLSVSKIANSAESKKYAFSARPAFMNSGGITPAERGTAMHKVIEFFDFDNCDNIEAELERLYEWEYITEREYNSIDKTKLKAFFDSDVFARIKKADILKREMRFLTEVPAGKISPQLDEKFSNENIIIQGAVDVCFAEADGVVILDFKTDRVEDENALIESYSEQLNLYAAACEKIFNKPVKQKIIYSFTLSREIEIK